MEVMLLKIQIPRDLQRPDRHDFCDLVASVNTPLDIYPAGRTRRSRAPDPGSCVGVCRTLYARIRRRHDVEIYIDTNDIEILHTDNAMDVWLKAFEDAPYAFMRPVLRCEVVGHRAGGVPLLDVRLGRVYTTQDHEERLAAIQHAITSLEDYIPHMSSSESYAGEPPGHLKIALESILENFK